MKLLHEDGREVQVGDEVTTFRGEVGVVKSIQPPHKPSSCGFVSTNLGYHYVTVYNLKWEV